MVSAWGRPPRLHVQISVASAPRKTPLGRTSHKPPVLVPSAPSPHRTRCTATSITTTTAPTARCGSPVCWWCAWHVCVCAALLGMQHTGPAAPGQANPGEPASTPLAARPQDWRHYPRARFISEYGWQVTLGRSRHMPPRTTWLHSHFVRHPRLGAGVPATPTPLPSPPPPLTCPRPHSPASTPELPHVAHLQRRHRAARLERRFRDARVQAGPRGRDWGWGLRVTNRFDV